MKSSLYYEGEIEGEDVPSSQDILIIGIELLDHILLGTLHSFCYYLPVNIKASDGNSTDLVVLGEKVYPINVPYLAINEGLTLFDEGRIGDSLDVEEEGDGRFHKGSLLWDIYVGRVKGYTRISTPDHHNFLWRLIIYPFTLTTYVMAGWDLVKHTSVILNN